MAQPWDMSFLSGDTPTALSRFSVCKLKCPWSLGWQDAQVQEESHFALTNQVLS